jgi:hypothetical protein
MKNDLIFEHELETLLPETYSLLKSGGLAVHDSVSRVILHGSRGPKGGARPDSDIDLSLIVDSRALTRPYMESTRHDILQTTLSNWQSPIELDLAVVFDIRNCGLKCFNRTSWDEHFCSQSGINCFGLYKTQRGYNGLVVNAGVQIKLMYPCLRILQRSG